MRDSKLMNTNMIVVAHAARINMDYPPNTLEGIKTCMDRGLEYIEVDLAPLAHGDFILFHNERLDQVTNRRGDVFTLNEDEKRELFYTGKSSGVDRAIHVSSLAEILDVISGDERIKELQLDIKVYPTSLVHEQLLKHLVEMIRPAKDKLRVTSCADWIIIKLRELDASIKLGFDPQFYVDFRESSEEYPPFKANRFGYLDDHPVAHQKWGSALDYLMARADSLWHMGAAADVWYMRYEFLLHSLKDGFDWGEYLHGRGVAVDAWTVDLEAGKDRGNDKGENKGERETLEKLKKLNVDRITSNTPLEWVRVLDKAD